MRTKDEERLNFLDRLSGSYSGQVCCRMSHMGRGWRLHETKSNFPNFDNVRDAIDHMMEQELNKEGK